MLRPERMSRVSVTGAKRVLGDVIETVHDLHLVHMTDYDGAWEGFEPGDPIAGADEAAQRLVTVRSLQSILGVDDERTTGERTGDVDIEDRLERVREEVNELDDRRDDLLDERRALDERAAAVAPLETLGIDLDLLAGYDSLETRVGEGSEEEVRTALDDAEGVERYETSGEGTAVAAFVHPTSGANDVLEDALVGADFAAVDVPDETGSPEEYVAGLDDRRAELDDGIEDVEDELDAFREEHADYLLAAEEQLAIDVEKREAPLSFATTKNAFVAEGWIPTERFDDLNAGLEERVGDHCVVEELERATYDGDGQVAEREPAESGETGAGSPEPAADGGADDRIDDGADENEEVRADGGRVSTDGGETPMSGGSPPVVQQNPGPVKPFEILTQAVGQPNYSELDPTVIVSLTLPAFFGFMIGDVGYGLVYLFIGLFIYSRYDSDAFTNIGIIAAAAGFFTALFGLFFGEIFGLHLITQYLWEPLVGGAPLHKGLYPANIEWANAWFVIAALVGVFHLVIAYGFEFVENLELHGLKDAMVETGSWLLALLGLWLFIFTRPPTTTEAGETVFMGPKPALLYEVFDTGPAAAFDLGFAGIPGLFTVTIPVIGFSLPFVELVGVVMILAGAALLAVGPTYELVEIHTILAHPLSYLRLSAELLAEVGLAFAVNLLFFGAYATGSRGEEKWHFGIGGMPQGDPTYAEPVLYHGQEVVNVLFPGLVHGGIISVIGGVLILIAGNLIVLALGVMSVGVQAIRLEYFEFFEKFYDGGGTPYEPFGRDRQHTTNE